MKNILKSTVKLIRSGRKHVTEPFGRGYAEVVDAVIGLNPKDYTLRVRFYTIDMSTGETSFRYYHVCDEYILHEEKLRDEFNPWAGEE
jgi:hypothetical protein